MAFTLFPSTRVGSVMLRRNLPVKRSVRAAFSPLPLSPASDLRSPPMVRMPSSNEISMSSLRMPGSSTIATTLSLF